MTSQTDVAGRVALSSPNFAWDHPIPLAVRLGNLVISSIIPPLDPATGKTPADIKQQVALVYQHMKAILEDAGGTLDDIARVTFYVRSKAEQRPLIDEEWNAMFSSSAVQPARLVIEVIPQAAPPLSVQCEFIALIGGGRI